MSKHEEKHCPRCGKIFECMAGAIALCQCSEIVLSVATRTAIEQSYNDCLCLACLQELEAQAQYIENT